MVLRNKTRKVFRPFKECQGLRCRNSGVQVLPMLLHQLMKMVPVEEPQSFDGNLRKWIVNVECKYIFQVIVIVSFACIEAMCSFSGSSIIELGLQGKVEKPIVSM